MTKTLTALKNLVAGLFLVVAFAPLQTVQAQEFETSADIFELEINKTTELGLYLTSSEAYKFKKQSPKVLFLDVRTQAEVNFLGMPDIADANIPIKPLSSVLTDDGKKYQRWDNLEFVEAVTDMIKRKGLEKDPVLFIMCRNGKGSAIATNRLANAGFTKVYSIIDGYEGDFDKNGKRTVNGWKNAGLPWSYGIGWKRAYRYKKKSADQEWNSF
ncbi:MAG: sulfurtransferase [Hyphomicrobiaceae bacterium]|nr:sulfurtransferase [Hyphomicrobiaceae bacterium]